jgi:hypothetical protein
MDALRDGDRAIGAAGERRLADRHPDRDPAEILDAVSHCGQAIAEAEVCAEQVREGRLSRDAAAACLAEQFPDLDLDQLRSALELAIDRSPR